MKLITAHRILIVCAIAFFVVYAVLKTRQYLAGGGPLDLVQAVIALAIAAAFRIYFRSLARWGK